MNVNLAQLLKKRLNKLDSNFKHYDDDMAFLTLTSRNDGALKDLLGIQLLRNAHHETIAREIARLDLAVIEDNALQDIIKLKSVYIQDFEQNPTIENSTAIKTIKRDIEDNLNKLKNPPKSWTYKVAEDARFHFAAIYIDVQADQSLTLPETKSAFLKQYPELKEGDMVYKSIIRHREVRDYSVEEIIDPRIQTAVFNPLLESNSDIYIKKGDIEALHGGTYKDFNVQVYFQTFEIGHGPEPEDMEMSEAVIETVDMEPSEVEATIEVDQMVKAKVQENDTPLDKDSDIDKVVQKAEQGNDHQETIDETEGKQEQTSEVDNEKTNVKETPKQNDKKKDKKQSKSSDKKSAKKNKKDNKKSKKEKDSKSEKTESKKDKKKDTTKKKKDSKPKDSKKKDDKKKNGKKKSDKKKK